MERRDRYRGQHGFALASTLAVLVVCVVLITGLLGVVANTAVLGDRQREDDREIRAAQGAIDAAIARVRNTPAEWVDGRDPCDESLQNSIEIDGLNVNVECTEDANRGEVVAVGDSGTTQLVADASDDDHQTGDPWATPQDGYRGTVQWDTDCATQPAPCFPLSDALQVPGNPITYTSGSVPAIHRWPNLVHSGAGALAFAGDLQVRTNTFAVRDPAAESGAALSVSGSYIQGEGAPYSGNLGIPCGISADPRFRATSIIQGGEEGQLPSTACDNSTLDGLKADSAALPAATDWTPDLFQDPDLFPNKDDGEPLTSGCPVEGLVPLSPGAYDRVDTATLNDWLSASECTDKTFWFKPGPYWFDVDDPSNPAGETNSLVFGDPSSNVVMGYPGGWDSSVTAKVDDQIFPEACNRELEGVAITLSPRTAIRHKAGRVSICGPTTGEAALWQDPAPQTDAGVVFRPAAGAVSTTSAEVSITGGNLPASFREFCPAVEWSWTFPFISFVWGKCNTNIEISFGNLGGDGPEPSPGPLSSAVVVLKGQSDLANDLNDSQVPIASTRLDVKDSAGNLVCRARYRSLVESAVSAADHGGQITQDVVAYDLLEPSRANSGDPGADENDCPDKLNDQSQLWNSSITATVHLDTPSVECREWFDVWWFIQSIRGCDWEYTINDLSVIAGRVLEPSTFVNQQGVVDPGNAADWTDGADPPTATFAQASGSNPVLRLEGVEDRYEPVIDSGATLTSAGVLLTGDLTVDESTTSSTTVTVKAANDYPICALKYNGVGDLWRTRYLDLKSSDAALTSPVIGFSRCDTALTSPDQLQGANVEVMMSLPGDQLKIARARVVATWTGGYTQPPDVMHVAMKEDVGAAFHVFGRVSLPLQDLDVYWTGKAPRRGIVEGTDADGKAVLILHGLGSYGEGADHTIGVVCCGPVREKHRTLTLRADVDVVDRDGNVTPMRRAASKVKIVDEAENLFAAGAEVQIEDAEICNRNVSTAPSAPVPFC